MTYKEEFITFMVRSGVLTFGDFTTKSGRKTPYFINTGNYKTGAQAAKLGDYYAACIQENLPDGVTCLFGPAYKGIPLAVTAGTAVRESIELFKHVAKVNMKALIVSVDRMERGTKDCSTLDELRQDHGIAVYPIVTVREIIAFLHNREIDGKVYIDDEMKGRMEAYLAEYGPRG